MTRHHTFLRHAGGLLCVMAAAGCGQKQAAGPAAFPPPVVTVTQVVARDVPVYLDEIGRTASPAVVSIEPQVSGKITEIHFTEGADLKKGDKLFTIDPRPYQAAFDQAQATLKQQQAMQDLSQSEFKRMDDLLPTKAVAQQDYDAKKSAVAQSEAQVQASKAAVETARLNLEYCGITSPIDGRAGQRLVDLGNVLRSDKDQPLLTIQQLDPIYADFTVTENDLPAVHENMKAGTLKVEVRLPGNTDTFRTGEVTFLDNAVQDGTGTVKLRATLKNPDHYFWPGQFVRVRLILKTIKDALLVPAEATQISQKGPFVYVLQPDATVQQRDVTPGQSQGGMVVIREGLKAGERVVVTGQLTLHPGAAVMVSDTPATQPATQPANQEARL